MKLDFEKFLNENGLKIGDKIELSTGDICEIGKVEQGIYKGTIILNNIDKEMINYSMLALGLYDFEKVEPKKKVGDIICTDIHCAKCPLYCLHCNGISNTIRENLEEILEMYPQLEPMRAYFEAELDKEAEE